MSNWSQDENHYDKLRDQLLDKVNLKAYIDNPFLFMKRQRVTDYISRIELFKKIINIQGSIVECGVYKGGSLMLYYHLSSIFEPYGHNRKIIGFDTFEGFRSISERDCKLAEESIFSDTSYELLKQAIELNDKNRTLSHIPKCEIVKGDAVYSIPDYRKNNPHLVIALLYIDFDLYEPTKVAIKELLPLVPKGGVVAFDELNSKKWSGETEALKEMLSLSSIKLQKFYFDPWPSYFIVGE
ncbi:MAG: dTDP-6-deoxy-L-hexose 3-O-methyltransferase [Candidatus Riflebacteria bacterium]|nr:dTDP-6-deoxy-L-hexose 3-O-methyltransferase [Candidatus Riflebacteria bacterium]